MTLSDIITHIGEIEGDLVLYVKRVDGAPRDWLAIACAEPEFEARHLAEQGFTYLLEAFLVKDVIAQAVSVRNRRPSTVDEIAEAVVYYSDNDAYLAP